MAELRMSMNDYRLICREDYAPIWPVDTYQLHQLTVGQIDDFCERHKDKSVVICTHHAPSKKSLHPRFQNDFHMNGGYSSDLSALIARHPNIKLWTHGHTHDSFDYMEGQTRIVCNPAGYQMKPGAFENPHFEPGEDHRGLSLLTAWAEGVGLAHFRRVFTIPASSRLSEEDAQKRRNRSSL